MTFVLLVATALLTEVIRFADDLGRLAFHEFFDLGVRFRLFSFEFHDAYLEFFGIDLALGIKLCVMGRCVCGLLCGFNEYPVPVLYLSKRFDRVGAPNTRHGFEE